MIGNGNVAIDVARVLAKTPAELAHADLAAHARAALATSAVRDIHVVGRRGPYQASFTPKEMGELGELARARPVVDPADLPDASGDAALEPGLRKVVAHLRAFAAAPPRDVPVTIAFDFFTRPVAIERAGDALRLTVERTRLDGDTAVGTGVTRTIAVGLIVGCIGYASAPLAGIAFDARRGRFANDDGRIAGRLYVAGWARRGPSGTIGTNKPDGAHVAGRIAAEVEPGGRAGAAGARRAARGPRHPPGDLRRLAGDRRRRGRGRHPPGAAREARRARPPATDGAWRVRQTPVAPTAGPRYRLAPCVGA